MEQVFGAVAGENILFSSLLFEFFFVLLFSLKKNYCSFYFIFLHSLFDLTILFHFPHFTSLFSTLTQYNIHSHTLSTLLLISFYTILPHYITLFTHFYFSLLPFSTVHNTQVSVPPSSSHS